MTLEHLTVRNSLPLLDQELLTKIFDAIYIGYKKTSDERIDALIETLYAMRKFNHHYRQDDTRRLFDLLDAQFNFERNSEGTTIWLALILAVQELYSLSDKELIQAMQLVTLRA